MKSLIPSIRISLVFVVNLITVIGLTACDNSPSGETKGIETETTPTAHTHENESEKCFLCDASLRESGRLWCKEHGRYEDRCWICQPQLEDKSRLWCKEHFLYEDECHLCHPELLEKKPESPLNDKKSSAAPPHPSNVPELSSKSPPSNRAASAVALFCKEHGVLEHECGICQPQLASKLKPGESMKVRFVSKLSTFKAGVRTATPRESESAPTISAFCQVRYNENKLAHITPRASGIVAKVVVEVGAEVKAGDVLAVLESSVLAEAKSDYLAKLQSLELSQLDLNRSSTILDNTRKALDLLKNSPSLDELGQLSDLELGLNRKDLLSAHAAFVVARSAYDREKQLLADEISSKADYQMAEAAYQTAWANHLATKDDVAFSSKRDMESKSRAVKVATFSLESARRRLVTLGLSLTEVKAISTDTNANLSRHEIRAPYDGTIVERNAVVGESVETGGTLFTLVDLSDMWISLSIPADKASLITTGCQVETIIPNLPGEAVTGRLQWIDTSIDERTRMVKARAVVPNQNGQLKSGMFGESNVAVGSMSRALRVPNSAVQRYERQPYVFVKLEDDLYDLRRVALGNKSDTATDIVAGIQPKERIVVAGTFTVMSEYLKSRLGAGCVDD